MSYTNFVNGAEPALSATTLNDMQVELMKLVFPIGSTYTTQTDVNPSTILNFGTWERIKGKVLVGLDEDDEAFNTIGKTGGEKTHTLTINEMPSHKHGFRAVKDGTNTDSTGNEGLAKSNNGQGNNNGLCDFGYNAIENTGGNQPHNNLQPYQVIGYMWIRTA